MLRAVITDVLGILNIINITDVADIVNIIDITIETGRCVQGVTRVSCNKI